MLRELCIGLVESGQLSAPQLRAGIETLMHGDFGEAEAAAFLTALRICGESAGDVAVAASVLREMMLRLDTGGLRVLDTCGTGGDGSGTFNISSAVAIVVAACGVPVVKHGNRRASSASGSADCFEALGVRVDADPSVVRECLHEVGLAFCFAPLFHPAMRHVADLRRRLGFRTIFNLLGPLVNPAQPAFQLIGVSRRDLLDRLATCLAQLGGTTAYLVHGQDGLDEVTLAAPTLVRHVHQGKVQQQEWTPELIGLPRRVIGEVQVGSVGESAEVVRLVVGGAASSTSVGKCQLDAAKDFVLANSAAALYTAHRVDSLPEGVDRARAALASGAAQRILERLIAVTNQPSQPSAEGK